MLLTLTGLTMMILSNVKRQWDAAISCCNLCLTRPLVTLTSSHLKCKTWWLLPLTPVLLLIPSSGAAIPRMSFGTLPLSAYLEIISTVQCSSKESGFLTKKQSAQLIHRVEAQMRQQQLISPSVMVTCTCMKCELIEMGTQTRRSWTF